jgi:hypothetical protein
VNSPLLQDGGTLTIQTIIGTPSGGGYWLGARRVG